MKGTEVYTASVPFLRIMESFTLINTSSGGSFNQAWFMKNSGCVSMRLMTISTTSELYFVPRL